MKCLPFIADTPAAALALIHEQLGPSAVVLDYRHVRRRGIARLWRPGQRVEVLAGLLDPAGSVAPHGTESTAPLEPAGASEPELREPSNSAPRPVAVRALARLERLGVLPVFTERLALQLEPCRGRVEASPLAEWQLVCAALEAAWPRPPAQGLDHRRPHVFIGPPGTGKTTVLCKWLSQAVLNQERRAQVWRLDTARANVSDLLAIHAEMVGVTVDRAWSSPEASTDFLLVDLPGVEVGDAVGRDALSQQLSLLPEPCVHLVLNAAYETHTLFNQLRWFEPLGLEDLIFTHVDELGRPEKLWNFVLGSKYAIRFLAGGQNVPGKFQEAQPRLLLSPENRP